MSDDYTVTVGGRPVPVYRCRVSAVPLNQVWPGYQRPLDQTELASFAYWDMTAPVQVIVIAKEAPKEAAVRPASLGIKPIVDGRCISFSLPRPAQFTVELDGTHHALHLFASPPEQNPPRPGDPNVRYFGPGVHRPGKIELTGNQTIYIAAGAVVHGHIIAQNAQNVRILGRGILDASTFDRAACFGTIALVRCRDAVVDGLVIRDPNSWTVIPAACRNVKINNLKLIGLWRYNSDGIDVLNSQDVAITNCFVRSFDDSIVVKGVKSYEQQPVSNLLVSNCVIWNDWGKALCVGPEVCAPEIADLIFRDCDIIRTTAHAMDITCGDRARIRNVCFENIRFEIDPNPPPPRLQTRRDERYEPGAKSSYCPSLFTAGIARTSYSRDTELGSIGGVHLKNIDISGPRMPPIRVNESDPQHRVQSLTVEGLRFNGQPVPEGAKKATSKPA